MYISLYLFIHRSAFDAGPAAASLRPRFATSETSEASGKVFEEERQAAEQGVGSPFAAEVVCPPLQTLQNFHRFFLLLNLIQ